VVVVTALIVGELSFRWAKHRGWTTYTPDGGLLVLSIAAAPDGVLWVGTSDGVSRFDGESWTTYTADDGLGRDRVTSLSVSDAGTLWFGTWGEGGDGVTRFDPLAKGEAWTTFTVDDGLAGDEVSSIAVAPDGAVWFGTGRWDEEAVIRGLLGTGVSRFDGEAWTTYTAADGLASDRVWSIVAAPDGTLWFGTPEGISRFDGETWTTYTERDGLVDNYVQAVAVAPGGALWVGTWGGGVSRFDGETWTTYTEEDGLASDLVSSIAVAPDSTLLFGASGGGVSRFDGETWATYRSLSSGLVSDWVDALAVDGQGGVWVAADGQLCVVDEGVSLPAQTLQVWAQAWGVARILGIAASVLLVVVWGIGRWRSLPAQKRAQVTGALPMVSGGLAVLLGLLWWLEERLSRTQDLGVDDPTLLLVATALAGLVLACTGLVVSIRARRGDMERQSTIGEALNIAALAILAYPAFFVLYYVLLLLFYNGN